jgi:hypothetical protein
MTAEFLAELPLSCPQRNAVAANLVRIADYVLAPEVAA